MMIGLFCDTTSGHRFRTDCTWLVKFNLVATDYASCAAVTYLTFNRSIWSECCAGIDASSSYHSYLSYHSRNIYRSRPFLWRFSGLMLIVRHVENTGSRRSSYECQLYSERTDCWSSRSWTTPQCLELSYSRSQISEPYQRLWCSDRRKSTWYEQEIY